MILLLQCMTPQELQLNATLYQQVQPDSADEYKLPRYQRHCRIKHCVTKDVASMLANPDNNGASFQVPTQFNTLHCSHSNQSPDHGISLYTASSSPDAQCAIACAPSLVYRYYKLPFPHQPGEACADSTVEGQFETRQINNLDLLEQKLGRSYWSMENGYIETTKSKLLELKLRLDNRDRNALLASIKVGLVRDAEVVLVPQADSKSMTQKNDESACVSRNNHAY